MGSGQGWSLDSHYKAHTLLHFLHPLAVPHSRGQAVLPKALTSGGISRRHPGDPRAEGCSCRS